MKTRTPFAFGGRPTPLGLTADERLRSIAAGSLVRPRKARFARLAALLVAGAAALDLAVLLVAVAAVAADMSGGGVQLRAGTISAGGAVSMQADPGQGLGPVGVSIAQSHPLEPVQGGGVSAEPGFWTVVPEPGAGILAAAALGTLAALSRAGVRGRARRARRRSHEREASEAGQGRG